MEPQFCELNSQSNKKNSDLSYITSSVAPTESQVPNESTLKKIDTKVVSPISQPESLVYDRTYFCKKILDQYPNLNIECSSENFDYYEITDETSCEDYIYPLCELSHDEEEIEGKYKAESYLIKCEIEITA